MAAIHCPPVLCLSKEIPQKRLIREIFSKPAVTMRTSFDCCVASMQGAKLPESNLKEGGHFQNQGAKPPNNINTKGQSHPTTTARGGRGGGKGGQDGRKTTTTKQHERQGAKPPSRITRVTKSLAHSAHRPFPHDPFHQPWRWWHFWRYRTQSHGHELGHSRLARFDSVVPRAVGTHFQVQHSQD